MVKEMITIIYNEEYYDGSGYSTRTYYEQYEDVEAAKNWLEEAESINNFIHRDEKIIILEILDTKEITIALDKDRIKRLTDERKLLPQKENQEYQEKRKREDKAEYERLKKRFAQ